VGQVIANEMLEEAAEGSAPAIARRSAIRAIDLNVIKEA
jgi:hypothetical protein